MQRPINPNLLPYDAEQLERRRLAREGFEDIRLGTVATFVGLLLGAVLGLSAFAGLLSLAAQFLPEWLHQTMAMALALALGCTVVGVTGCVWYWAVGREA